MRRLGGLELNWQKVSHLCSEEVAALRGRAETARDRTGRDKLTTLGPRATSLPISATPIEKVGSTAACASTWDPRGA